MRYITTLLLLIIASFSCFAQDSIDRRIILVGDAGSLVGGKAPVLDAIRNLVPLDNKTTVLYLGDNLYHDGLPDEQAAFYDEARTVLDSQVALISKTKANGYMIPGNHDWSNGSPDGYSTILRQQAYVDKIGKSDFAFLPKDGCPGPVEVPIGDNAILIVMDSQWWIHQNDKPGVESDCPYKTKDEVLSEIKDIAANNSEKLIIFACHHPFISNGIHGGYFGLKQHIFPLTDINHKLYVPLPVIGSLYPIARGIFGTPQDLHHPNYQEMVTGVKDALKDFPNVIYVAGHEHTLQLLNDSSNYYIISGSGCKHTRVQSSKRSDFTASALGFATLEISKNKNVRVSYYTFPTDTVTLPQGLAYTKNLMNFSKQLKPQDSIPATMPVFVTRDSALVPASTQYGEIQPFKEKMMGINYRSDWGMPIMLKTFDINKTHGGFKIINLGGGKQTKSITIEDKNGIEWKLRTIDKDPAQALPSNFRSSIAKDFVQDLISASQPYAPLVLPKLEQAAMIPHSTPEYYFVPDDPSFGLYQKLFANKMCMLEKKNATADDSKTKSTSKVLGEMLEDNDHVVDQNAVLRARLFDIFVADWDRHFDQWRWGIADTGKGKLYYPIPKDRDQALFHSDGLLIKYAAYFYLPFLKGFRKDIPNVKWMGYSARDFDRVFLNRLDAYDWQSTICEFQKNITDTIITSAVHDLPPNIYALSGPTIEDKLKSRRDLMMDAGMKYYEFLSEYVNVVGSNDEEYFHVSSNDSGLKVEMYNHRDNDTNFLIYSRVFDPSITKEVRLFGLNGDDVFNIDSSTHSRIKLRLIGGKGADTFSLKGNIAKHIYDLQNGKNYIVKGRHVHNHISTNLEVNDFDYKDYKYQNTQRYPYITGGYNTDDGILGGLVYTYRTYGFRKEPYATENRFWGLYSFAGKAYQLKYNGTFIDLYKGLDILANFEMQDPVLYNFFGLGNETKYDQEKSEDLYYNARFKFVQADILFRQRFFKNKLSVSVGPSLYHYWNDPENNEGKILEHPENIGLNYKSVYETKTYLGVKASVNINNLNNLIFPTRGVNWTNELLHQRGLGQSATSYTKFQSDMAVYASLSDPAKIVAVLRFGGGKIFSDSFEYFQAVNLGSNNFLRGFRKNRFSGSSSLYNSVELRIKLLDIRSRVIPGTLGAIVFNDIGRVWYKNEDSNKWHDAYGAGLYFLPFRAVILSATVGRSAEETVYNFTIGTKLNLTF
jgi:hypothetical protein